MLATDTKALSEEIAQLFAEIQQQTQLYAELMTAIRQQADDCKRSTDKLLLDAQKLKSSSDNAIEAVEIYAKQTIQQVADKAASVEKMFQELDTVRKSQHDAQQLIQQLAKKKSEFEAFLRSADSTLQHRVHEKFHKIDGTIKNTARELHQEMTVLSSRLERITDLQNRNIANIENNFDEFKTRIGEIKFLISQSNELSENIKKLIVVTVNEQIHDIIKSIKHENQLFVTRENDIFVKQPPQYQQEEKPESKKSSIQTGVQQEQQQKKTLSEQPLLQEEMVNEIQALRRQLGELKNALKKSESNIESVKKNSVITGVLAGITAIAVALIV